MRPVVFQTVEWQGPLGRNLEKSIVNGSEALTFKYWRNLFQATQPAENESYDTFL